MKTLRIAIAGAAVIASSLITLPGTASAHHPQLVKNEQRPCGLDQPWTGTFTATADMVRGYDWRSTYTIGSGAATGTSGWVPDSAPFGPVSVGEISPDVASVTVSVTSEWKNSNDVIKVRSTRSITLIRPASYDCDGGQPVAPTVTPPTCDAPGSVVGTDTDAYTWTYGGPDSARTATAVARPGYTLTGPTSFGPYDVEQYDPDSSECNPCSSDPQLPADSPDCNPTTTVPPTTTPETTVPSTTTPTTTPGTTAAPTTTTPESTVPQVASGGPTTTSTPAAAPTPTTTPQPELASAGPTTTVGAAAPAGPSPVDAALPKTGNDATAAMVFGAAVLILAGFTLTGLSRRSQTA